MTDSTTRLSRAAAAARAAVAEMEQEIVRIQSDERALRARERRARERGDDAACYAARSRIADLMAELMEAHNEVAALRQNADLAAERLAEACAQQDTSTAAPTPPSPHLEASAPDAPAMLRIHSDGGSRGNPGIAGCGTVVATAAGEVLDELAFVVGKHATNNVAEYQGLINGLARARERGARRVEVFLDSKLVVEQMSGRWKIKNPDMKALALEARRLAEGFETVIYEWVPRRENAAADALANEAMDQAAAGHPRGFVGRGS